jgi:hypothetical protein
MLYYFFLAHVAHESTRNSLKSIRVQKQAATRNKENNFWLFKELLTAQSICVYSLASSRAARMQRYRFVSEYFFLLLNLSPTHFLSHSRARWVAAAAAVVVIDVAMST